MKEATTEMSALCFDATGTLIETAEPVGAVYRRVALEFGVDLPAWRLDDAFRRVLRHAPPRGLDGETPSARRRSEVEWWSERVRQTFQATDSTIRFADFPAFAQALFERYQGAEAWRARPGASPMLATLRERRWPLAVVSNFDHRLTSILEAIGLKDYFEYILVPCETGLAKPDQRLFERAASLFQLPLAGLGYVGDDSPETLRAIADQGIRVFDAREITSWSAFPDRVGMPATLRPASSRAR